MSHIKIIFVLLFLATASIQAQNCYETGMNESRAMFKEAQRLKSIGAEEEAVQMFLDAFKKMQEIEKNCKDKPKPVAQHTDGGMSFPFYAAISAGAGSFGTVTTGNMFHSGALAFGADVAYFFNTWLGAGVKLNMANRNVNFGNEGTWRDRVMFVGPGVYARWAKNRIEFTAGASVGSLQWKMSNVKVNDVAASSQSASAAGAFLWTGVNYLLTQNIGIGLNVQSALGTVKNDNGLERNPAGAGVTLGVNYRF